MEIAINYLTRMKSPYICVAGVARDGSHVRPVLPYGQIRRIFLGREGGPFSLGHVLDLGLTQPCPARPEVEDVEFIQERVKSVGTLNNDAFLRTLGFLAKPSLQEIFGPDLERMSGTAASVLPSKGKASLGILRTTGELELSTNNSFGKPEIRFSLY